MFVERTLRITERLVATTIVIGASMIRNLKQILPKATCFDAVHIVSKWVMADMPTPIEIGYGN